MNAIRSVFAPHLGRNVKLGRRAPKSLGPHLKLSRYLKSSLPPAPTQADYSPAALPSLRDVMGNDNLGDCVIASANHCQGVVTGNAGALVHATLSQIIAQYSAIGGYNPNDPNSDQGCDEVTALNWYVANGFANGVKPLGWVLVDGTNPDELESASFLFEQLIVCAGLPDAWINPFPSGDGFVWDTATSDPNNGHSFMSFGYSAADGLHIDTWGLFGTLTYDALAKCCTPANGGGVYCLLTPEMLTRGQTKAPNGVAWSDLVSDFDSIGGTVPAPSPVVTPPAPAPPGSVVTLAQAQGWATAALAAAHPLLTRGQAESIVAAALASNWPK